MTAPAIFIDDDADATIAGFVAYLDLLDGLEGIDRRQSLIEFARSHLFHPAGMLLEGGKGRLHREAWRALESELGADTPGKRWNDASHAVGRGTISRLLGVEGHPAAGYATYPFRTIWTQEDEPWIGAAVGCPPLMDTARSLGWCHLDIENVILWNPRDNSSCIMGESASSCEVIEPIGPDDTLTVYADVPAFFSAWARARINLFSMAQASAAHPFIEPHDSGLPGALIVGDIGRAVWRGFTSSKMIAGPGVEPKALRRMLARSVNLPRVLEDDGARG